MNNTTAGRLLNILIEGKKIPKHQQCITAWEQLLDVPSTNKPLLFKRLGSIMTLPLQVESIVINTVEKSQSQLYLQWLKPITKAFTHQNLSSTWETFSMHIDQHTINYLTMTRDILQFKSPEGTLAIEELEKLKSDFLELEKEIMQADMPLELQKFILKRIKEILNAISEYKINGLEPLIDTIDMTIGKIVSNKDLAIGTQNNDFGKKFWDLIVASSVVITLATGIPQLENTLENLLPLIQKNHVTQEPTPKSDNEVIDVPALKEDEDS